MERRTNASHLAFATQTAQAHVLRFFVIQITRVAEIFGQYPRRVKLRQ